MFRDNKREIFGFRKYKAYGLASAVIAAFFLMGGVASADEVTSTASSDTTAHVVSSPTEAFADKATVASGEEISANNAVVANTTVENTVANTATTNTVTVGFTEAKTKLHGDFVITGTDKSEKHLTKSDQVTGAYNLQGTYTFSASGIETITGAKLVYESSKQFLEKPEFDVSVLSTGVTDKSDNNTWRYEFALSPIGGTTVGQMTVKQRSKGMIWSGPTSTEQLKGTFKIVQSGIIVDTDSISVTTDRVKGGLYRSDRTLTPTEIRDIAPIPIESMIGIHQDGVFSAKDSANFNVKLPAPSEYWYLWNRDDANVQRDYERYTDFKYSISGIPDYLELDPTVRSNEVWSREGDKLVMHLTPSSPFNGKYYNDYQPRLRLKPSALNDEDRNALIANTKRVYLTWRTDGVLSDGSTYTQELPDPNGILLKTRNAADPLPEGTVVYNYGRTRYADPLREKSDHSHESIYIFLKIKPVIDSHILHL